VRWINPYYSPTLNTQYDAFGRTGEYCYDYGQYNYLVYMGCNWDYQSNLTRRYDGWHSAWDQRFSYDRLDRLYSGEQGPYQGTPNATWEWDDNTVGGPDYLDKLGNWVNFNNTGTLDERNHNAVNEIDSREVSSSSRIVTYDAAGNLATLQAAAGTAGRRFTHDFRNRLIEVEETDDITAGTPALPPGSGTGSWCARSPAGHRARASRPTRPRRWRLAPGCRP